MRESQDQRARKLEQLAPKMMDLEKSKEMIGSQKKHTKSPMTLETSVLPKSPKLL